MDTWTEVFTDEKGIRRCRRCQHARPSQFQTNSNPPQTQTQTETTQAKK